MSQSIVEALKKDSYITIELANDKKSLWLYENLEFYGNTTKLTRLEVFKLIKELTELAKEIIE